MPVAKMIEDCELVLPEEALKAINAQTGDWFHCAVEGDQLVLTKVEQEPALAAQTAKKIELSRFANDKIFL